MTICIISRLLVRDNFMIYNLETLEYFYLKPFMGYHTFNGASVYANIVTLLCFVVRERHCPYP